MLKNIVRDRIRSLIGNNPEAHFHSDRYIRHNQRRLEHLASLCLPIANRTVLEVGAGIGDHTSFFIDRGCSVCATEARAQSLRVITKRFPGIETRLLDLDNPDPEFQRAFAIVYAYGVLYHLSLPADAIAYLARRCEDILLLETCVSYGDQLAINPVVEDRHSPSQALVRGCRPTRPWVMNELHRHFEFVYIPKTQPWHEEFPTDWSELRSKGNVRGVFIASRRRLDSPQLSAELLSTQSRV
jgi:hypothetical protein